MCTHRWTSSIYSIIVAICNQRLHLTSTTFSSLKASVHKVPPQDWKLLFKWWSKMDDQVRADIAVGSVGCFERCHHLSFACASFAFTIYYVEVSLDWVSITHKRLLSLSIWNITVMSFMPFLASQVDSSSQDNTPSPPTCLFLPLPKWEKKKRPLRHQRESKIIEDTELYTEPRWSGPTVCIYLRKV